MKLYELLKRVHPSQVTGSTLDKIKKIEESFRACRFTQQHHSRFQFTIRDDATFNHCVFVDMMKLNGVQCIHVVDNERRFQPARRLISESAASVWNSISYCWIDVYLGPPEVISKAGSSTLTAIS